MLGIRRYGGIALDLWVGSAAQFVSDFCCDEKDIASGIQYSIDQKYRHLSVVCTGDPTYFTGLKQLIDEKIQNQSSLKRITQIFASVDLYNAAQKHFFSAFPEVENKL